MANFFTITIAPILLLSILFTTTTTAAAKVTGQELDAALFALRSRGYTLFPNAITTSDIRLLLLTLNSTFTLFSPPDPLIYSLDLSSTAPVYVHSLLRHVSPIRLSMSDLRSIRGSPYLETLIPPHRMSIDRSLVIDNGTISDIVLVDGVRISFPDLFLGSGIVVHGLEGILVSGLGSNSRDGQVDLPVDPPVVSPASWSEKDSPAISPTPEAGGLSGILTAQLRAKRRDDSNDGGEIEHGRFVKYCRRRFGV